MPANENGAITVVVLLLTGAITMLFWVLIARATYRSMILQDSNAYMRCIILNDTLDRIRNAVANEVAAWAKIPN